MRAPLSLLDVVRPRTVAQALAAMADANGNRPVPLAGGTDLFVTLNAGGVPGRRFLDLTPIAALRTIRVARDSVTIGALATFTAIRHHAVIARRHPALVAAAAEIGAVQIQNRATIGGNIANASPAGDSLPVLLADDALVHVRSLRGTRAIPFDQLYTGYRAVAIAPDELIVAIELPAPARGSFAAFRKVGTRRAQSISKVVFAGRLALDAKRRVADVRLAWGSVAPVPVRARAAEAVLRDQRLEAGAVERAVAVLGEDLVPIDDIRSEREYRMQVAANLLRQFARAAALARR